jgi:cell division protein FtsB
MTIQTESTQPKSTQTRRRGTEPVATVAAPPAPQEKRSAAPSRSRTAAAQRAYARRAQREGRRVERVVEEDLDRGTGRVSFAVLIIVVLTVGVAATLWLSTQAIADSYRLEQAKQEADQLAERAAALQREVTEKESASWLAERAKAMGMVPAGDPARLVVGTDGSVTVVGEPTPVQPPPPAAPPAGQEQPAGETPAGGQTAGTGQGAG